jgi:hypothetical protein
MVEQQNEQQVEARATTPSLPAPEPLDEAKIQAWALENRKAAQVLGRRLISTRAPEELRNLPSLGAFEDAATAWAIKNPTRAKLLILRLVPLLAGAE